MSQLVVAAACSRYLWQMSVALKSHLCMNSCTIFLEWHSIRAADSLKAAPSWYVYMLSRIGLETGRRFVSQSGRTEQRREIGATKLPVEYHISVSGQEMVVKMTSNCEAIGLNAIIQTVENDSVSSASFGNSLHRHCYRGEVQSSHRSKVVLTSMQEGLVGFCSLRLLVTLANAYSWLPESTLNFMM